MNANHIRKKYRRYIDLIKPIYKVIKRLLHFNEWEKNVTFGNENRDKVIYIIRSNNVTAGMFSIINTVLEHCLYAESKGYIPVVDLKNYMNSYLAKNDCHKENAWEYYFEQPSLEGIGLDSAYASRNVILSDMSPIVNGFHMPDEICDDEGQMIFREFKRVYERSIKLKTGLKIRFDTEFDKMFGEKRVLGILCRGTDYIRLKPYAHPIQPKVCDVIKLAKRKMIEWKCECLYLCTEDQNIVGQFENEFGDKLYLVDRNYYRDPEGNNEYITNIINKTTPPKKAGEDYLRQIYFLTKCSFAILSRTSATPCILFSSDYIDKYIWNLGRYGFDD